MLKKEIAAQLADKTGMTKRLAGEVIDTLAEIISDAVSSGDRVYLSGFGVFELREYPKRQGYCPSTQETVEIPVRLLPVFKPGVAFKSKIKEGGN